MNKEFRIIIQFGYKDWICSKVHYGVRINSKWFGYSRKFNTVDEMKMIEHFVPELKITEIVSTKELADCFDPSGEGQYAEISVGNHGAALYAVWKMSDDERSPNLEANVKEIIRRVNQHDKIIAKIRWMVESCDCTKLTDDFVRKHFEECL